MSFIKLLKCTKTKFTSKDLFVAVYSKKIIEKFKAGKLDENMIPLETSIKKKLTSEKAKINARNTGLDIF